VNGKRRKTRNAFAHRPVLMLGYGCLAMAAWLWRLFVYRTGGTRQGSAGSVKNATAALSSAAAETSSANFA